MNTALTLENLLANSTERFPEIVSLYEWSTNYSAGNTPFTLFIDLIGYSVDEIGEPMYNLTNNPLGYLELDYLGDALKEYASKGESAYDFVIAILDAERGN